jgi:hypothetical protein
MHQGKNRARGNSVAAIDDAADAQGIPSTLYMRSSPTHTAIAPRAIRMRGNCAQRTRWRRTALGGPQRCQLDPITASHAWSTHRAVVRLVSLMWVLLIPGTRWR